MYYISRENPYNSELLQFLNISLESWSISNLLYKRKTVYQWVGDSNYATAYQCRMRAHIAMCDYLLNHGYDMLDNISGVSIVETVTTYIKVPQ